MEEPERPKHILNLDLEVAEVEVDLNRQALEAEAVVEEQIRQKVAEEAVLREDWFRRLVAELLVAAAEGGEGCHVLEVEVARFPSPGVEESAEHLPAVMAEQLSLVHWVFWVAEVAEQYWLVQQHVNKTMVDLELERFEMEVEEGQLHELGLEEAPALFGP